VRLFVAVNPADAERQRLFDAIAPLRAGTFPFRWVMPESIHITLRFLGSADRDMVDRVGEALDRIGGEHAPVTVRLQGVGAFPSLRRPRVLWFGADGGPALLALQAAVERAVAALGFEPESREWTPHLTLARSKSRVRPASFSGLAAIAGAVEYRSVLNVASVDLMHSHIGPGGARYERIVQAPLRGTGRGTAKHEAAES
jgi:2'-5' RNA ligase